MRTFNNWVFAILIFFCAAVAFTQTPFPWLADFATIAVLYFMVFHVLNTRAIKIRCPHCGKILKTNTPWVCGFCGAKNQNANDFPFVYKCEHCGAEQKAYNCHHGDCGKPILLTEDVDDSSPAYCAVAPAVDKTPEEVAKRLKKKEALKDEVEILDLQAKKNERKSRLDLGKKKKPSEAREEDFEKFFETFVGDPDFAIKKKAYFAEKYKGNRKMLKKLNAAIDAWLRRRLEG